MPRILLDKIYFVLKKNRIYNLIFKREKTKPNDFKIFQNAFFDEIICGSRLKEI